MFIIETTSDWVIFYLVGVIFAYGDILNLITLGDVINQKISKHVKKMAIFSWAWVIWTLLATFSVHYKTSKGKN